VGRRKGGKLIRAGGKSPMVGKGKGEEKLSWSDRAVLGEKKQLSSMTKLILGRPEGGKGGEIQV